MFSHCKQNVLFVEESIATINMASGAACLVVSCFGSDFPPEDELFVHEFLFVLEFTFLSDFQSDFQYRRVWCYPAVGFAPRDDVTSRVTSRIVASGVIPLWGLHHVTM